MTKIKAKEQGFTHRAKMYGFIGYFKDEESEFVADWIFTDWMVEFFVYIDVLLEINPGFPILLLHKI